MVVSATSHEKCCHTISDLVSLPLFLRDVYVIRATKPVLLFEMGVILCCGHLTCQHSAG